MNTDVFTKIEEEQYKKRPDVQIGDTVKLHMKIKEGDKERVQIFEGVVIAMKGSGMNKMLTVRKISMGVGVERIVPFHAPTLEKIEVVKRAKTRRSKLYFMRKLLGKKASKIAGAEDVYLADEEPQTEAVEEVVEEAAAEEAETTDEVPAEAAASATEEIPATEESAPTEQPEATENQKEAK